MICALFPLCQLGIKFPPFKVGLYASVVNPVWGARDETWYHAQHTAEVPWSIDRKISVKNALVIADIYILFYYQKKSVRDYWEQGEEGRKRKKPIMWTASFTPGSKHRIPSHLFGFTRPTTSVTWARGKQVLCTAERGGVKGGSSVHETFHQGCLGLLSLHYIWHLQVTDSQDNSVSAAWISFLQGAITWT